MQNKRKGFPISEWQNDRFSTDCFSAVMHAWWFIIAQTAQSCDQDWCITMYSGLLGDYSWQYSTIKMIIASKAVSLFNPIWLSFSFSNRNRFFFSNKFLYDFLKRVRSSYCNILTKVYHTMLIVMKERGPVNIFKIYRRIIEFFENLAQVKKKK